MTFLANFGERDLTAIVGGKPNAANVKSVALGLQQYGVRVGLDKPHRLAHYVAQIAHESGGFRYDRELWGDTPAQQRYDMRTDLGNTPAKDGDGYLYRGRTGIQITGKANTIKFTKWAKKIEPFAPDFVAKPDLMNTDPWEGLGPIWYWDEGSPLGKSLNVYADRNDIEMVTRRVNGGMNGFADRVNNYVRSALYLLGHQLTKGVIGRFQKECGLTVDDIAGPKTRDALHKRLLELSVGITVPPPPDIPAPAPTQPPAKPVPSRPESVPAKPVSGPWAGLWAFVMAVLKMLGGRK